MKNYLLFCCIITSSFVFCDEGMTEDQKKKGEALYLAANLGRIQEVRELLAEGADPNFVYIGCSVSNPPLHVSHPKVVGILLTKGADPRSETTGIIGGSPSFRCKTPFESQLKSAVEECSGPLRPTNNLLSNRTMCDEYKDALKLFLQRAEYPDGLTASEVANAVKEVSEAITSYANRYSNYPNYMDLQIEFEQQKKVLDEISNELNPSLASRVRDFIFGLAGDNADQE